MFCKNCGIENTNTAKFCKNCGTPLDAFEEAAPIKPKKKKKGCLIIVLILAGLLLALIVLAALNGGEVKFSSANINDATIASQVDPNTFEPIVATDVFTGYTPIVYVTAYIKNVPSDTKLAALWTYIPTGEALEGEPVILSEDAQIQFNVEMPNGFNVGEYKVDLLLNDEIKETLYFSVE